MVIAMAFTTVACVISRLYLVNTCFVEYQFVLRTWFSSRKSQHKLQLSHLPQCMLVPRPALILQSRSAMQRPAVDVLACILQDELGQRPRI